MTRLTGLLLLIPGQAAAAGYDAELEKVQIAALVPALAMLASATVLAIVLWRARARR